LLFIKKVLQSDIHCGIIISGKVVALWLLKVQM
jgi:hypothetical protein